MINVVTKAKIIGLAALNEPTPFSETVNPLLSEFEKLEDELSELLPELPLLELELELELELDSESPLEALELELELELASWPVEPPGLALPLLEGWFPV